MDKEYFSILKWLIKEDANLEDVKFIIVFGLVVLNGILAF